MYYPVTVGVGSLFGVEKEHVDRTMEKHHNHHTPKLEAQSPLEHEGKVNASLDVSRDARSA